MQCLRTYDMDAVKQNTITINLDDANLAEILKKIIADADITVGEVFDDQDILDHVHDGGMPIDEIFDEDEILTCGCVIDAMDELEKKRAKTRKKNAELEAKVAELEKELAEFREWNAKMKDNGNEEWCRRCGSWQREGWNGIDIIRIEKDAKWGCVCEDCLHHLDNEDHERCEKCDGCKDCGCCECDAEETEE